MTPRTPIFISAVSKELKSARQLVANTLQFLGYEPVWQDIFGTEQGDLREMLRKQIDECKGVVQLVGQCYGAEPTAPDEKFGRVGYTQYEALYARQQGKKVWYLLLDESFPADSHEAEPEELHKLQAAYRQRVQADLHLFHPLHTNEALEASVLKMKSELVNLRRGARRWAVGVTALLIAIIGLVAWLVVRQETTPAPKSTTVVIHQELPRTLEPMTDERAESAFNAKNYAAAFDAYARLSTSNPTNITYHRRIEECARLGRLEKPFLDRYLALVQQQPTNAIFQNYLGNACLMIDPQDKDGKAREQYEMALRFDSKLSLPLANLGILAYRTGKSDEAESYFKCYLAAETNDSQGWVNLGLLYVAKVQANTGDTRAAAQAENALRKAVQIDPGSASAYKGLGRLWAATDRKKEALNAFQRSYAINDEQPEVRQQVELLAWESGGTRFPGTLADDFKTRSVSGGDTNVPAAIIVMQLLDKDQFQQAEATCIKWTEIEPDNPLAWRLLGRACEKQGHADDARRAVAQAEMLLKRNNH